MLFRSGPTLVDAVVGIVPGKELAQDLGPLGVTRLQVSEFLVGEPEKVRDVLVHEPSVLGQLPNDLEATRITRIQIGRAHV